MKITFIYSLVDPRSNQIRYIGKSNNPKKRLSAHLSEKRRTHKSHWIQSLKKVGLKPILNIVDEVLLKEWEFWEMHYISLYKSWGFDLTNQRAGGGGLESHSTETKELLSSMIKKEWSHTPEFIKTLKERMSGTNHYHYGRPLSFKAKENLKQKAKERSKNIFKKCKCCQSSFEVIPYLKNKREYCSSSCAIQHLKTKKVFQYDLNGNFIREWENQTLAAAFIEGFPSNISRCCSGKIKQYKKYIWSNELIHNTN